MSLFKSVITFGGFTLISRITGFLRDMILASWLGAGMVSDAFLAAFKLPNLFRSLFAEGALTTAFVPMLSGKLANSKKEDAIAFASRTISILAFFVALFVILIELFMPYVVLVIAPGFADDPEKIALTTKLSRLTFPFLLFISIVSFQSGILNSLGKFAAPAAAPVILNLMMILSVFIFVPLSFSPAEGIAFSVTFAGFVEILVLRWFLHKNSIHINPMYNIKQILQDSEIITLLKRIAPGILGAGIYQINMAVDLILVSNIGDGALSWLYYANRLQQLPLGVVGAAISVALLPILSAHLQTQKTSEAQHTQNKAIEYGALLSFPAAIALITLATPIVNILFEHGKFNAHDTIQTSSALIAYAVGLPMYVMTKALSPNFFARGDTKTPVKYSIVVFICNIIFILILMPFFGHIGVACATTLCAFVSFTQYVYGLKKRNYWNFSATLLNKLLRITISSILMGGVLILTQHGLNTWLGSWLSQHFITKIAILTCICGFGIATFFIFAKLTGAIDITELIRIFLKRGNKNAINKV
ncbi:MAG: murein biosynthesis integral membrane protein MurJ [Alphaproteobacteria bacterium]|nr:murein biosynthesis integral membrane protein MurJ [Alphaproteobacteria bacterium]